MNGMNGSGFGGGQGAQSGGYYLPTKIELNEVQLLALLTAILSVGSLQDPSIVVIRAKKILEEAKKRG